MCDSDFFFVHLVLLEWPEFHVLIDVSLIFMSERQEEIVHELITDLFLLRIDIGFNLFAILTFFCIVLVLVFLPCIFLEFFQLFLAEKSLGVWSED